MLENSITDRVIGSAITECQQSPNKFVHNVCTRALAIALPLFHMIDAIHYAILYTTTRLFGSRKITQIDPEQDTAARFLALAKEHLSWALPSVPKVMTDLAHPLPLIEQKMDLPKRAITYQMMPLSRLGDNLSCYFNAKWVAHKTGLPLIFKSFPHADELAVVSKQSYTIPSDHRLYSFGEPFSYEEFEKNKDKEVVWEVPFMALFDAKIDWSDEQFRASILEDLATVNPQSLPPLAKGRTNVALHLRTGGDFDAKSETFYSPTKVPPREYFENALLIAFKEYKDVPLHIQIFTDSTTPDEELKRFTDFCKKHHNNVTLRCDTKKGKAESMVVQDMIAMTRYQGLIRADSGLSKMSSLIGKPELEISPPSSSSYRLEGPKIHLDKIKVVRREKDAQGHLQKEQAKEEDFNFAFDFHIKPGLLDHFYAHHVAVIGEKNIKKG